jgi:hypothetical protein
MKNKGLGDTVEKITIATGIKKLVGDCVSCDNRKSLLNQRFPYGSHVSQKRGKG